MDVASSISVCLLRHGLTRWNQERRYLGSTDVPLLLGAENGLKALKYWFHAESINYERFYTSELKRAKESALFLNSSLKWKETALLNEYNFGEWEGKTYADLSHNKEYRSWIDDMKAVSPPRGESFDFFTKRIEAFLEGQLLSSTKPAVVMTHGGVIRQILSHFHSESSLWDWKIEHGQGYNLFLKKERESWICESWSEVPVQEDVRT